MLGKSQIILPIMATNGLSVNATELLWKTRHHQQVAQTTRKNPWNRRNVISLWDYEAFEESDGLLPCAFQVMFDVRQVNDTIYLDATLTQRSNDMLVAHHINAMQYVALQPMIAKHFGWTPGNFYYFVNNLHIYDNQFEQAKELLKRTPSNQNPQLILDVPNHTNFYDIKADDLNSLTTTLSNPN